jgi:two-component system, NarL family, nitrate/nitrite response regulator NarL
VSAVTSVLIVDDVLLGREGLADLLRRGEWVGEVRVAADIGSAVGAVYNQPPDVVLLSTGARDGLVTLAAVRAAAPAVPVVALAVTESEEDIVAWAEAGAAGFLPREGTLDDLEKTVAGVINGETVCSPKVAGLLLRRVTTLAATTTSTAPANGAGHLTPREREVLLLIERGMTNKQIAQDLGIEVRTVKNHVHNLLEKLRVSRRGEAAARLRSARVPPFEKL